MIELLPMKIDEFNEVLQLIDTSFPESERRTKEQQKALLNLPNFEILIGKRKNEFCGFMSVWHLKNCDYVELMAVDEHLRGQNCGSSMFKELFKKSKKQIILEVEPPTTTTSQKRIAFYQRLGFALNTYTYVQPPLQSGQPEVPLLLMSQNEALSLEAFENIKNEILHEVYHKTRHL